MWNTLRSLLRRIRVAGKTSHQSLRSRVGAFRPLVETLEGRVVLDTIRWISPVSGDWSAAANWDLSRAPAVDDDVVIDVPQDITVLYDANVSIASLNCTRNFRLISGRLEVRQQARVTGDFFLESATLRGGRISADTTVRPRQFNGILQDTILEGRILLPDSTQVTLQGAWRNNGVITIQGGTLNLGGSFTADVLGTIQRTTGLLALSGTLNNQGATLVLDDATGPLRVAGGTIDGGTVTTLGSARVFGGGRLRGLTINGTLEAAGMEVVGGLTLNGTAELDGDFHFVGGQTLSGIGTVDLGSNGRTVVRATGGTVTLGPSITVRGRSGLLRNVLNRGTVLVENTLNLGTGWVNQGLVRVISGALILADSHFLSSLGNIQRAGGEVYVTGALDLQGATLGFTTATGSWTLRGGTVQNGVVTSIGGATLLTSQQGGTLDRITLRANVTISFGHSLTLAGAWRNEARLLVNQGTLTLGGTFTQAELGTIQRTGGEIIVAGVLTNTGDHLRLDAATGTWNLRGGRIDGGTVTASGGARLAAAGHERVSRLNGVTYNGELDVTSGALRITNGLTLNGTLLIGNSSGGFGFVGFEETQALTGNATVLMGGTLFNSLGGVNGTLYLSPGVIVRVGGGTIANFVNRGLIENAGSSFNLTLEGSAWRNEGILRQTDGMLGLGGTFTLAALGNYQRSGGGVELKGALINHGSTLTLNAATGSWVLAGGTIHGGTVTTSQGATLIPYRGTLNDVTIATDLTVDHDFALTLTGAWRNERTLTLRNGTLNLAGSFTTQDLGILAHTGGRLYLRGTLVNQGSSLVLDGPARSWYLAGGTIDGGTVNLLNGATFLRDDIPGRLNGVTLPGTPQLERVQLRVTNGLTVNGTLRLTSAALEFEGAQTLGGSGTVVLAGGVMSGQGGMVTFAGGITIRGGDGRLGNFINRGTIELTSPGSTLVLGHDPWRNEGVLRVADGTLELYGSFTSADVGDFRRSGGRVVLAGIMDNRNTTFAFGPNTGSWELQSGRIRGGTLTATGGATLLTTSGSLEGVTLDMDLNVSQALTLEGAWSNRGTLNLAGGFLNLGGTFTLADVGTLNRAGGTVVVTGTLDNVGTTLTLDDKSGTWVLRGGRILGGTVTTSGAARLEVGSGTGTRLDGVIVNGYLDVVGGVLRVSNGLTVNGILALGFDLGRPAQVLFEGSQTLDGKAVVLYGRDQSNVLGGSAGTVTIAPTVTLRGGSGSLSNFLNQGVVVLDSTTRPFSLGGSFWRNEGTITLNAGILNLGGTFTVASLGALERNGGTVNLIGTLENVGQTLHLDAAAGSWLLAGGAINGGTVTTAEGSRLLADSTNRSFLRNVTLQGALEVLNSTVEVVGGLTVHGEVRLGGPGRYGALVFRGSQTLGGSGVIQILGNDVNRNGLALLTSDTTLTLAPGLTIRGGAGHVGFSPWWSGTITGLGLIHEADLFAEASNQTLHLSATTLVNRGALRVENGARIRLERRQATGSITHGGLFHVGPASTLQATATITQTAGVTVLAEGTLRAPRLELLGGILEGTGTIEADVLNNAWLAVGFADTPGLLSVVGNYIQTSGGVLSLKVGGREPGLEHDVLSVTGIASLGGLLDVTVLDGFRAAPDDEFELLTFTSYTGEFATIDGLFPTGQEVYFDPIYDLTSFRLLAIPY